MKYTVLWTDPAEQDLASIWLKSRNRPAVAMAANSIDQTLTEDPDKQGESRDGNIRVVFAAPLGVEFEVSPDDRIVYVVSVWSYAKK